MKTTDFINESFVEDAAAAHQDHEVQMARGDCYNAAKYAIELHKLLKNISEQQGLDGWVSEKITLANDYLRTVTEYLRYEQQSDSSSDMPEFDVRSATQTLDAALGEAQKPAVVKTNKPIGTRVADIGPGGKEYNVKTNKEWDKQNKQKDVKEGMRGTVSFPDDEGTHTGNNPPVSLGGTFAKRPEVKAGKLVKASGLSGVWRVNDIRGDQASITQEIPNTSKSYSSIPVSDLRVWTNKPVKEQGKSDYESDPLKNREDYAKRHSTGQVYKKTYPGDKVGMSKSHAYDINRTGPKGVLPEENMSRAAKGHEKYGKAGMQALAKAGREGANEKELDTIRDKHDKYDESIDEAAKKGLYYYVNKRKKAGTSRDKDDPKAPTAQAWKDAAKTAKKESVAETTSSGSMATSMGGGNGFVNGGPGTIARPRMKKKK